MAAFLAALLAALAIGIGIGIRMAESVLHVGLRFIPLVTIIACLVTIRVRSLWPAAALAALVICFYGYTALLNASSDTKAGSIAAHLALAWAISGTGQIAVGALAGWLWYHRESRSARAPASA